jgi:MFS family permease
MHKILRALILSDLFILGSFGLIQPIFAIFIMNEISGATVVAVGIAETIQLVVKSVFQIIVGKWADEESGNRRELAALIVGSILQSLVPLGYLVFHNLSEFYILQVIYGLGLALAYPGWMVVFTRYTREDRAGYEWGVYNTTVSLGTAIAATLGAYLADLYGFHSLFIVVSLFSFVGTALIIHVFIHGFVRLDAPKHHIVKHHKK